MHSRSSIYSRNRTVDLGNLKNIPIECIRKTRSLNIDNRTCRISKEVYKILKSTNGRKIFA
ncbi:MAG: hypothetical protein ABIG92_04770 [Candidatus Omnitrophota bacterium]